MITYQTAFVECTICTNKWVAIWPVGTIELQCPHCDHMVEPIIHKEDADQ